jgi:hypothetical protein
MPPPDDLLEVLRQADEDYGDAHDIGWDGSIVIDHYNIIYWVFVDSQDMVFAARVNSETGDLEIVQSPFGECTKPDCPKGDRHLGWFLREHIEPDVHMFMAEGGPAYHDEEEPWL